MISVKLKKESLLMKNKYILFFIFYFSTSFCLQLPSNLKTARSLERQKNYPGAISIYLDLLQVSPNNYQAFQALKTIYIKTEQYKEGITLLEKKLDRNRNDMMSYIELYEFYFLYNNKDKALSKWLEGFNLFKNNKSYYRLLLRKYVKYNLNNQIETLIQISKEQFGLAFLSEEIGDMYRARGEFEKSLNYYLIYITNLPQNIKSVKRKVLLLSEGLISSKIFEKTLNDYLMNNENIISSLLSDYYFKKEIYDKSFQIRLKYLDIHIKKPYEWLRFTNNLKNEFAFEQAINGYKVLLKNSNDKNITNKSLLGLAETFESQIFTQTDKNLIPYFYDENIFFEDLYKTKKNVDLIKLQTSLNFYDSLLVTIPNSNLISETKYKLSEIQFRVIKDFKSSLAGYKSAISKTNNTELSNKIACRISDVLMSTGNYKKAIIFLDSTLEFNKNPILKYKKIQAILLSGKPDIVHTLLDSIIKNTKFENEYFNDLFELKVFLEKYYINVSEQEKILFNVFLKAENLLKQNKLEDAISLLENIIISNEEYEIIDLARFRIAILFLKLNKIDFTINYLNDISSNDFKEKSVILLGQINENIILDKSIALKHYLKIINNYEASIYLQVIRHHIRNLNEHKK